jgi:hypothetical protein
VREKPDCNWGYIEHGETVIDGKIIPHTDAFELNIVYARITLFEKEN